MREMCLNKKKKTKNESEIDIEIIKTKGFLKLCIVVACLILMGKRFHFQYAK